MTPDASVPVAITEITRRALIDEINLAKLNWAGRLEEQAFLARLYDLTSMPSRDPRFSDAGGDIWQHRVNNYDWDDDWIFYDTRFDLMHGSDEQLLRFLCETVHPAVRPDQSETDRYVEIYNRHLRADGYQLHIVGDISGRPIYGARSTTTGVAAVAQLRNATGPVDAEYIARQITRMESAVNREPDLAIGTAKELLETVAKTILDERNIAYGRAEDLPALLKKARNALKLSADDIDDAARGADLIRQLFGNLGSIVQSLAELRNHYGTGHGKSATSGGLSARHARLAAGAAATLATFMLETHDARRR